MYCYILSSLAGQSLLFASYCLIPLILNWLHLFWTIYKLFSIHPPLVKKKNDHVPRHCFEIRLLAHKIGARTEQEIWNADDMWSNSIGTYVECRFEQMKLVWSSDRETGDCALAGLFFQKKVYTARKLNGSGTIGVPCLCNTKKNPLFIVPLPGLKKHTRIQYGPAFALLLLLWSRYDWVRPPKRRGRWANRPKGRRWQNG